MRNSVNFLALALAVILTGCASNKKQACSEEFDLSTPNEALWAIANTPGVSDISRMKKAIECGADVNAPDTMNGDVFGGTPVHLAAFGSCGSAARQRNDSILNGSSIEMLKVLESHGANLKALTPSGANAVMLAAECGRIPIIQYLLNQGVDVNNVTKSDEFKRGSQTPIHRAVACASPDLVQMLLEKGGNPNVISDLGETPLDRAMEMVENPQQVGDYCTKSPNPQKVVELLKKHGAKSANDLRSEP